MSGNGSDLHREKHIVAIFFQPFDGVGLVFIEASPTFLISGFPLMDTNTTYDRPVATNGVVGGGRSNNLGNQCFLLILLWLVEEPVENALLDVGERGTSGAYGGCCP